MFRDFFCFWALFRFPLFILLMTFGKSRFHPSQFSSDIWLGHQAGLNKIRFCREKSRPDYFHRRHQNLVCLLHRQGDMLPGCILQFQVESHQRFCPSRDSCWRCFRKFHVWYKDISKLFALSLCQTKPLSEQELFQPIDHKEDCECLLLKTAVILFGFWHLPLDVDHGTSFLWEKSTYCFLWGVCCHGCFFHQVEALNKWVST